MTDSTHFVLLAAAAIVVLLKAWQGWRLGLVRQLVNLGALIVASGSGVLGARAAADVLRPLLPYPERLLAVIGGLLIGAVVYGAITIVGAILFKKTGDQSVGLVRIGYGLSGAAVGAIFGVLLVGAFALALRLLGSVAETTLALEKNPHLVAMHRPAAAHPLAVRLAEAKRSIEESRLGAVLQRVDPLPETTYTMLTKLALLAANSRSIERFLGYPGVRPVMNHPKVVALLSDPEVNKAIAERRYLALLSNPRLVAAADDPEVSERLRAIDFEKALDYALRGPEARR
ncbi:MAG TPA: CvpA family protein [Chthoniobacteraceae bacterium]|nr:CvpA family protein [Chthoniobacteraceae bacterium]